MPQVKYNAIIRAGEALLCEGYDKAQPQLIAKTAGVSVGLFYRYFANKRELLTDVVKCHLKNLHGQLVEEVARCDQPVEALKCYLVLTLRYFRKHQGLIKLFFMEIGYGDVEATERLKGPRQTNRDILQAILQRGISQQVFLDQDALDVEIAINSIIGTINWSLYNLLVVQNKDIEPDELAARIMSFISRSLVRCKDSRQC
jgi:AcrR family transcriptional regulator